MDKTANPPADAGPIPSPDALRRIVNELDAFTRHTGSSAPPGLREEGPTLATWTWPAMMGQPLHAICMEAALNPGSLPFGHPDRKPGPIVGWSEEVFMALYRLSDVWDRLLIRWDATSMCETGQLPPSILSGGPARRFWYDEQGNERDVEDIDRRSPSPLDITEAEHQALRWCRDMMAAAIDGLPSGQPAPLSQQRLRVETSDVEPYIVLDRKPLSAPEDSVMFLAALIEADGYPVPFAKWIAAHPQYEGRPSNRVIGDIPTPILRFVRHGKKGEHPRLLTEELGGRTVLYV